MKKILESFKNLEKLTYKIMKNGFKFCFILTLISIIILLTYEFVFTIPNLYYIGISLFRLSLIFAIEFIVCGFVVDGIKKQLI